MHQQLRQAISAAALAALGAASVWSASAAESPKSIRIGYVISLSGVNAQGAATTTLPGYNLWVKDVNDKGGIMVAEFGRRIPVEVAAKYDDTSNAETLLRLEERLMTQDKVDLSLGAFTPRARTTAPSTMDYVFDIFPRLAERRRQAVRTMSGGEQQMVAVGRALMAQPSLLLLDEPSLGLAPLIASELFIALERIAVERRMSILLVEQNARRALKMASRAYLLSLGRIVGEGDSTSLAHDRAVAGTYLGL